MLEETGFYLNYSNLRGAQNIYAWSLLSHKTQHFPCSQTTISQNKPQSSPFPYLKLAVQTVLQPLWKAPKLPLSHSGSPLQDLGYGVISLGVIVQESMCRGALGHSEVQERHKSQEFR